MRAPHTSTYHHEATLTHLLHSTHTSAYVSLRQHTSAFVSIHQHTHLDVSPTLTHVLHSALERAFEAVDFGVGKLQFVSVPRKLLHPHLPLPLGFLPHLSSAEGLRICT